MNSIPYVLISKTIEGDVVSSTLKAIGGQYRYGIEQRETQQDKNNL